MTVLKAFERLARRGHGPCVPSRVRTLSTLRPARPNEEDGMKKHLAKIAAVLVAAATMTAGLMHVANSQYYNGDRYNNDRYDRYEGRSRWSRGMTIRAGTPIDVRLDSRISTEDASSGDAWTGMVFRDVVSP